MNAQPEFEDDDKPLDPATEKVRRKLARFGAIFMGINIVAVMAVLGAIVYKLSASGDEATNTALPAGFEGTIDLPAGAEIISASETGGRVLINMRLADGGSALWFYDIASSKIIGKLAVD